MSESVQFVNLGYNNTQTKKVKNSDGIYINRQISGYNCTFDISEQGKLSVSAFKVLGRTGKNIGTNNESTISIRFESVDHLAPDLKAINIGSGSGFGEASHVELADDKERVTDSFKEELKYYKRQYPRSSIITVDELFNELIPSYQNLLNDTKLNTYISKISNESANIQKPYNRGYVKEVIIK